MPTRVQARVLREVDAYNRSTDKFTTSQLCDQAIASLKELFEASASYNEKLDYVLTTLKIIRERLP